MLHKIIEPTHALPCAAFRLPFARTEVGNDQDSLLFIRHRKFRVQTLPKTSQGSPIHRLEYGAAIIFFEDLKLFDMQGSICEAMKNYLPCTQASPLSSNLTKPPMMLPFIVA